MSLYAFNPQRFTDSQLYVKVIGGNKLLIKTYLNADKFARRDMELTKNQHWRKCGFDVPEMLDMQCAGIVEPHVVMRYVPGIRLSEYLKNGETAFTEKLVTLEAIFKLNYRRHGLALAHNDLLLLHTDPNTDNIILDQGAIWFIDFEHIAARQDVLAGVGNEVATFARRVIKDLGIAHTSAVIRALLEAYQFNDTIMDKVEELTFARPFQFMHRLKHALRKRTQAKQVTRYDIADAIRNLRLGHKE